MVAAGSAIFLCYSLGVLIWLLLAKRKWLYGATYFALAALLIGLPWVGLSLIGGQAGAYLAALSPIATFASMTGAGSAWFAGAMVELPLPSLCVATQFVAGLAVLMIAGAVLSRRLGTRRRAIQTDREVATRILSAASLPSYFERLALKWDNPIAVSTCRTSARAGATLVPPILMGVVTLVALAMALTSPFRVSITPLMVYDASIMASPGWRIVGFVGVAGWGVACLAMALSLGTAFAEDRRRENFGFVLLSPMSSAEIVDGRFLASALPVLYAMIIPSAVGLGGAVLALSPLAAVHWLVNVLWMVAMAGAVGYAALSGALGLTVSDARGIGNALALLVGAELGRWTICAISRASLRSAPPAAQTVGSLLAGALLVAAAVGILFLARSAAHSSLKRLRERDPFAA
jgi:hypothetical protein